MARNGKRTEVLHVTVTDEQVAAVDNFRFARRMPNRASAIRELLRRGLEVDEDLEIATRPTKRARH